MRQKPIDAVERLPNTQTFHGQVYSLGERFISTPIKEAPAFRSRARGAALFKAAAFRRRGLRARIQEETDLNNWYWTVWARNPRPQKEIPPKQLESLTKSIYYASSWPQARELARGILSRMKTPK